MLCESEEKTLHKSDEKYQAYVKILEEELDVPNPLPLPMQAQWREKL